MRRACCAVAATWLVCAGALAQAPLIPGLPAGAAGKEAKAAAKPADDGSGSAAELRARLAGERKLLEVLDGPGGLGAGAPPGGRAGSS